VKGASSDALEEYKWSSYPAYVNTAQAPNWLSRGLSLTHRGSVSSAVKVIDGFTRTGTVSLCHIYYFHPMVVFATYSAQ